MAARRRKRRRKKRLQTARVRTTSPATRTTHHTDPPCAGSPRPPRPPRPPSPPRQTRAAPAAEAARVCPQCLLKLPGGFGWNHVFVPVGLAHRAFGDAALRGVKAAQCALPCPLGKLSHDSLGARLVAFSPHAIWRHSGAIRRARNWAGADTGGGYTVAKKSQRGEQGQNEQGGEAGGEVASSVHGKDERLLGRPGGYRWDRGPGAMFPLEACQAANFRSGPRRKTGFSGTYTGRNQEGAGITSSRPENGAEAGTPIEACQLLRIF